MVLSNGIFLSVFNRLVYRGDCGRCSIFEGIEQAHEKGIKREVMMAKYRRFKEIVPSQAEEKTIFREFEEASGYISYPVVKQTKEAADGTMIKIVPKKNR